MPLSENMGPVRSSLISGMLLVMLFLYRHACAVSGVCLPFVVTLCTLWAAVIVSWRRVSCAHGKMLFPVALLHYLLIREFAHIAGIAAPITSVILLILMHSFTPMVATFYVMSAMMSLVALLMAFVLFGMLIFLSNPSVEGILMDPFVLTVMTGRIVLNPLCQHVADESVLFPMALLATLDTLCHLPFILREMAGLQVIQVAEVALVVCFAACILVLYSSPRNKIDTLNFTLSLWITLCGCSLYFYETHWSVFPLGVQEVIDKYINCTWIPAERAILPLFGMLILLLLCQQVLAILARRDWNRLLKQYQSSNRQNMAQGTPTIDILAFIFRPEEEA